MGVSVLDDSDTLQAVSAYMSTALAPGSHKHPVHVLRPWLLALTFGAGQGLSAGRCCVRAGAECAAWRGSEGAGRSEASLSWATYRTLLSEEVGAGWAADAEPSPRGAAGWPGCSGDCVQEARTPSSGTTPTTVQGLSKALHGPEASCSHEHPGLQEDRAQG